MSKKKPDSLAEALPKAIERSQELLQAYIDIGPVGSFGAAFIKRDIKAAIDSLASGDVIQMLKSYETLKNHSKEIEQ